MHICRKAVMKMTGNMPSDPIRKYAGTATITDTRAVRNVYAAILLRRLVPRRTAISPFETDIKRTTGDSIIIRGRKYEPESLNIQPLTNGVRTNIISMPRTPVRKAILLTTFTHLTSESSSQFS
jgi:hypothetical protein